MGLFRDIGFSGLLDISLMSMLIYTLLVWFKRSKAAFVLIGICIIGFVYLIARQFNLFLTAAVFQGFFAVILVAVIIIFQEDLKYLFERVALWSLNRGVPKKTLQMTGREVEILVRAVTTFAREKIGALIVLRGRDIIDRHLQGGVDLNGDLSEPILESLFDPHSDGHDGAVIIEKDRITKFSCLLPLSKDLKKVGRSGTRHASALGLAELSDALCLVASEEHGTISVARHNEIEQVSDPEKLTTIVENFYHDIYPAQQKSLLQNLLQKNYREKVTAIITTLVLWFFFVHESRLTVEKFSVPVQMKNLSGELLVTDMEPSDVEVTISGKRSLFYFFNRKQIGVFVNMLEAGEGTYIKRIQKTDIVFPKDLSLESVTPTMVKISLTAKSKAAG